MAKDSKDLFDIFDRFGEIATDSRIFKKTLSRYSSKLSILRLFLEKQLFPLFLHEDLDLFKESLRNFLDMNSIELYSTFIDLSYPEKYQEITLSFQELNQRLLSLMQKFILSPFNLIHSPWCRALDSYYDWYECSIETSNDSKFMMFRPSPPRMRQIESNRFILLNQIESVPDWDNDDDEDTPSLPECIKGYFTVVSQSPVHLKLISVDGCANQKRDGLLRVAYSLLSIPRSEFLHRIIAISNECSHLRSFRSEDPILPFSSERSAIGLVSLLAPFGSLKLFLSQPPEETLVDELTYSPLSRSKGGVLSPDIKISILFDVCSGLAYLHSQGYLHGRLHHNNVLIFPGFRARLTDFGISHQLAVPDRKYICKNDEIEIIDQHKEKFTFSKIGNDPRWYAPELVLRDIKLAKQKVKSNQFLPSRSFGTIAVSII